MCMVYTIFFTICIIIKKNKQTNNSIPVNKNCNIGKNYLNFMNAFDITKKCYKST